MGSKDFINQMSIFPIQLDNRGNEDFTISDIMEEEKCLEFLDYQKNDLKAPNLAVAASIFLKRYADLTVSSTLNRMIEENAALSLPLENCKYTKERSLAVREWTLSTPTSMGVEREEWREEVLKNLFSEHITPVIQLLTTVSRLPVNIAWENIAARINTIYKKLLEKESNPIKKELIYNDFQYVRNTDGKIFNLDENPLKGYLKIGDEHLLHPLRSTCCMYYRLPKDSGERKYCGICPMTKAIN